MHGSVRPVAIFLRKRLEGRRLISRQREPEPCAQHLPFTIHPVLSADLAAMRLHDSPADSQAQTNPGLGGFLLSTREFIEERLLYARRQTRTVIIDANPHVALARVLFDRCVDGQR